MLNQYQQTVSNPWESQVFWSKVGEKAADGVAQAVVRAANDTAMARWDLFRITNHHINGINELNRQTAAMGWGLANPDSFRMPYGQTVVNNTMPMQAAPEKKSWLGPVLATALGAATIGGGGAYGAYALLKDQMNKPVQIAPGDFKAEVSFDPEKGIQVGPIQPDKKP